MLRAAEEVLMKVAVIGSRGLDVSDDELDILVPSGCATIVSGGARGIDRCAARYAKARGLGLVEINADWGKYGRGAGVLRNPAIIDAADEVVALWDGKSRGTQQAINYAMGANKKVHVYRWDGSVFVRLNKK